MLPADSGGFHWHQSCHSGIQNCKVLCLSDNMQGRMWLIRIGRNQLYGLEIFLGIIPALFPVLKVLQDLFLMGCWYFLVPAIPAQYYTRQVLPGCNRIQDYCEVP